MRLKGGGWGSAEFGWEAGRGPPEADSLNLDEGGGVCRRLRAILHVEFAGGDRAGMAHYFCTFVCSLRQTRLVSTVARCRNTTMSSRQLLTVKILVDVPAHPFSRAWRIATPRRRAH